MLRQVGACPTASTVGEQGELVQQWQVSGWPACTNHLAFSSLHCMPLSTKAAQSHVLGGQVSTPAESLPGRFAKVALHLPAAGVGVGGLANISVTAVLIGAT